MRKIFYLFSAITLCIILFAYAANNKKRAKREELYIQMQNELNVMSTEQLKTLADAGHLSAFEGYGNRFCLSEEKMNICNTYTIEASERGNPVAMNLLAMKMSLEGTSLYNPYQAYVWVWIESHFRRDMYDFGSDFVRGFQELDDRGDYVMMRQIEEELGPEKIAQARAEAEEKMVVLGQKLEEYCKEWQKKDHVCFYRLGEQPSYSKYKKYVREKYGL